MTATPLKLVCDVAIITTNGDPLGWQTPALRRDIATAVKYVRDNYPGFTLKSAKDAVEHWLNNPEGYSHPGFHKVWVVPSDYPEDTVRVIENGDGTFNVEVTTVLKFKNLGELLRHMLDR